MYTQNGSSSRLVEAVLIEVIWPEFIGGLEAGDYSNKLFVPIRFLDFTPGYDTNSAVLFPETVAVRETPTFTWGAIFADREAARFRRVLKAAADITSLELPDDAAAAARRPGTHRSATFVMWDLIHDRTHMRGDLPFDPFMIKQRMPFFLYSLEELRCDLTAFRESVRIEKDEEADPEARRHAKLVQYAVIFDRIFRFAITGSRVRNYDGLGGQLLFAWMHQHHVLHWTDSKLTIDWDEAADVVVELGAKIEELYWRSIDRPKTAHWLAAYELISARSLPTRHPSGPRVPDALPLDGPPRGLTDQVLDDEFPLSMFYEALEKKMRPVIESTAGITGVATASGPRHDARALTILVTGGSSASGIAVTRALGAAGHRVLTVGSDERPDQGGRERSRPRRHAPLSAISPAWTTSGSSARLRHRRSGTEGSRRRHPPGGRLAGREGHRRPNGRGLGRHGTRRRHHPAQRLPGLLRRLEASPHGRFAMVSSTAVDCPDGWRPPATWPPRLPRRPGPWP